MSARASNADLAIDNDRAAPFPAARFVSGAAALLALGAFYALEHPFSGIVGDSKIYMGRALADLDPSGVGRDLMFRLDGQSQFSLFTPVARWFLGHFPLALVAATMAAAGGFLWFAGALAFARRATPGRALAAAAVVFAAPAVYGPYRLLSYAEALAEPRPYAEAFTIFALAAFLGGRLVPALVLLAVAAALHPIMALAGVAAIGLALCVEDRRWLLLALVGAVVLAGAVALDAPMAGRLRVFVDAQWLSLLTDRNAYLFPHLWKADDFILPAIQSVTILLAASRAEGRFKRLLYAGLATGAAGVFIAAIAGAFLPSLLVLQAQTWRMWWLAGFLSAFSLAFCAMRLGAGEAREKFALAMLGFAWVMASQGAIVFVALAIAVLLATPRFSRNIAISAKIADYTWLGLAAAVLVPTAFMLVKWANLPATEGFAPVFTKRLLAVVGDASLLGAIAIAAFGPPRAFASLPRRAMLVCACVAAALGAYLWYDPDSYAREIAEARVQPDLKRMTPRDGEILWLQGSLEPWVWLRRPHWLGDIQGAGIVFSRDLAMLYSERANALAAAALDNGGLVRRYADLPKEWLAKLDRRSVAAICARSDAPAYIVAPVASDAALDPALAASLWRPPALRLEIALAGDKVETTRFETYAVVDCAGLR
ncbi:MAG: hypothetical protein U1E30_05765 [Rhodoblastus sp.]